MKERPSKQTELTGYEEKPKKAEITWVDKKSPHAVPIAAITGLTLFGITVIIGLVVGYIFNARYNAEVSKHNASTSMAQFTYCLQTAMSESSKINKPITAKEAQEICQNLQKAD